MRFKTVKNGYDPAEVEEYIKRLREVYDKTLTAQRERIFEQRDIIEAADKKIAEYESEKELVGKPITSIETLLAAAEVESEPAAAGRADYFDYDAAQNPSDDLVNILGDLGIIHDDK